MAEYELPVSDEVKGNQTRIVQSDHFPASPFDYEEGKTVLGAKNAEGDEFAFFMQLDKPREEEYVNPGIDSVQAMEKLLQPDYMNYQQAERKGDSKDLDEYVTPTAEEIDQIVEDLTDDIDNYEDTVGYWPRFTALMDVWPALEEKAQGLDRDRIY